MSHPDAYNPMTQFARVMMDSFDPNGRADGSDTEGEPTSEEGHLALTLGRALEQADRPHEALEMYCRAVRMYGAVGERGGEAIALTRMATLFRRHASRDQIAECWQRALSIAGDAAESEAAGAAINLFTVAYNALGRHA